MEITHTNMDEKEVIKLLTDYFNQLEDSSIAKYNEEVNGEWSQSDSYTYTPEYNANYASVVSLDEFDTIIKYGNYKVLLRCNPQINIFALKMEYFESVDTYENCPELDTRLSHVTKKWYSESHFDLRELSIQLLLQTIKNLPSAKKLVELHIVSEKWEKNRSSATI